MWTGPKANLNRVETMMLLWTLEISKRKKHVNIGMKLVCEQTEEDMAL